ncbi:thymidylate synthase [candidate division KSB1 bacterium]|nr:thymidylate synthase [candidate division KSB1 bacterium]NIR70464.1 thymidylate synthase [candidate division KSB1 bacterium]NIS23194.1 thymidylate synthase [candidate division KSB1 bacterium]NIT70054.1 thymidylate synthase [candidate division KSB1 bacterium]NIU23691.1 thymidylate synthase [candidate division KSB1 bacterium]
MRAYLDLVERVLSKGSRKSNRTGVDTLSRFSEFYRVDLSQGYPLLTTKEINFKAMLREVLWYLSGQDHIRDLRKHTKIWDAWADEDGNLETAYGRFWRRFPVPGQSAALGAEVFVDEQHPHVHREPDGSLSFDQVGWAIDELKTNPDSRRIVITAWHPANAAVSKLPPCHITWVLNVQDETLNCHLSQRSADLALGIPFNLAAYSLLTQAIAQEVGLKVGEFVHTLVDAHIYVNHIEGLKEQIKREPFRLPQLKIANKPFHQLQFEDFELVDYRCHERIRFEVAV